MEIAFNRFKSTALLSLGYLATTCPWENRLQIKDLPHVISDKWHDADSDSRNQKSRIAVEKASSN